MAADLDALRGPVTGRRQLPLHLGASARAVFKFSVVADREHACQLVLLEAGTVTDLEHWLACATWSGVALDGVPFAAF